MTQIVDTLDEWERHMAGEGRSQKTRDRYVGEINLLSERLDNPPVEAITPADLAGLRGYLAATRSPGTLMWLTAIWRVYFRWAGARFGFDNPAVSLRFPHVPTRDVAVLSDMDLRRMIGPPPRSNRPRIAVRDWTMLTLMVSLALRSGEIQCLDWQDVDLEQRTIRVLRKGGKEQILPLNDSSVTALARWLEVRRGDESALFFGKGGRVGYDAVSGVVKRAARRAGLDPRLVWPHLVRHSSLTLHAAQSPLHVVKSLAGHASVKTTERYLHTTRSALREAVERVENPPEKNQQSA